MGAKAIKLVHGTNILHTARITSSTTISEAHAADIKAQVQQAINEGFAKARTNVAEVSKSGMTNPSPSVIDLVTPSPSPQQVEESGVLPASPISVASTPSQSGNGGSAPGLSRLTHATTAASPPQIFATMHWKPKEPPCFFGRSTEDVHTWTSLVRHYLSFMGGSDVQQVAYAVTLLRESAHEWYIGYERRHRHSPRDWAQLCDLLLERFGSNIRSQEAQSTLMSISQGQRLVRDYASQFETLLGRLDSYDENMMLNQFIWGLQPELARSVSLQYPKSIAQAVSLAETTELAVKASRRPAGKISGGGNTPKGPTSSNRGQGRWRGNAGRGRGRSGGGRGVSGNRGRSFGGGRGRGGNFGYDPLACYRCGVRGHLARDCPSSGGSSMSGSGTTLTRGTSSKSGRTGPGRSRGRGRHIRFAGFNVMYDSEGQEYPVDDYGQIYIPLESELTGGEESVEDEKEKNTKN